MVVTYLENLPERWAGIHSSNGNIVEDKHKEEQKFSKMKVCFLLDLPVKLKIIYPGSKQENKKTHKWSMSEMKHRLPVQTWRVQKD